MSLPDLNYFEWTADILKLVLRSPLFWWSVIISLLYLIEKFDLGLHCFSWFNKLWRHQSDTNAVSNGKEVGHTADETHSNSNGTHSSYDYSEGATPLMGNGHIKNRDFRNERMCNGLIVQNGHVPTVLNRFIRRAVIPTFQPHTKGNDPHFSVLVLSNISTMSEVKDVNFRQVTFNGRPLVDPKRSVYPQSYRYDNYIVARPSGSSHAETLIIKDLQTLVKAYGVSERCYLRSPVPKFGLLYCWAMPCSKCVELIVKHLSSICTQKFVLVYSQENSEKWSTVQDSRRNLKSAGVLVAKIAPE